jgi:predicted transcriptional regulator
MEEVKSYKALVLPRQKWLLLAVVLQEPHSQISNLFSRSLDRPYSTIVTVAHRLLTFVESVQRSVPCSLVRIAVRVNVFED